MIPQTFHFYQLIIIVISVWMIYQGIRNLARGKNNQTIYKLSLRLIIWGGMIVIALFPDMLSLLAKTLGIIDNMNAVILTGFLLVFLMIFKLLSAIERLEQDISEITRKESLSEIRRNELRNL